MNSHEVFIHIHQSCFAGTGAIVRLPQCQWSKPDGHGKISQCINTTKHSKAKTVCIFLGIYCNYHPVALIGLTFYSWPWWRHKMETFSTLLAFCEGNPSVTGGFPSHRPITAGLDDTNRKATSFSWNRQCWWNTPMKYVYEQVDLGNWRLWRPLSEAKTTRSANDSRDFDLWHFDQRMGRDTSEPHGLFLYRI